MTAVPRLRWPDLRNARDLGGIATGDGGQIRERRLVRTDNHGRLGPAGRAALRSYGVSRIIDLRWAWEAARYPSPLAADERYRLVPARFDVTGDEEIPPVDAVAADYALSEGSAPATMVNTLAHLDARYGGVAEYLIGSGMTTAGLAAVRARLTRPGGSPDS